MESSFGIIKVNMKLSQNFTTEEFEKSNTALRRGIDNSIPKELLDEAMKTASMMENIRLYLSTKANKTIPIKVSSAYRCLELNRIIGSLDTSDHILMKAVDFEAPEFGTPYEVCKSLVPVMDALGIGQIIYEHTWVHVSSKKPDKLLNRILTVQGKSYTVGIQED
jgi:zinc D-Ala-D-Ala carboxypeptidase